MIVRASQRRVVSSPYLGVYFRNSRSDNASGGDTIVVGDGENYLFRAIEGYDFVIKDASDNEYLVSIVGGTGAEQVDVQDGQPPGTYTPKTPPVSSDGSFYEVSVDGYLRLKNITTSNWSYIIAYNDTIEIESPGVASNPRAGTIPNAGPNFKFDSLNRLLLWDTFNSSWKYITVVADGLLHNAVLQLVDA